MQPKTHHLYFCHLAGQPFDALSAQFPGASCHDFSGGSHDAPDTLERLALALHDGVRRALSEDGAPPVVQVVLDERQHALRAGAAAQLLSIRAEYPAFRGQAITVNPLETLASLASKLAANATARDPHVTLLYRGDARYALGWEEQPATDAPPPWRAGHAYLIAGGFGGLGRVLVDAIGAAGLGNRVVVAGRSSLDEDGRELIEHWAREGLPVSYVRADVAERAQVERLIGWTLAACGRLDGVMHCAGVIRDNLLVRKPADEFRTVLAPKARGAVNLDDATRRVPLSFFALFSSVSSVLGNAGQTDYAAGNGFMDGYARLRAQAVRDGLAHGRTVSVNWPYWRDGGMRMDDARIERMWRDGGMRPLSTPDGLQAFYRALALDAEQLMVVAGDAARLRAAARAPAAAERAVNADQVADARAVPAAASAPPAVRTPSLPLAARPGDAPQAAIRTHLTRLVAAQLGLAEHRVRADTPLGRYGIDSVMMMKVIAELETDFGSLPKTIFFEYQTLDELADYFVEQHGDRVAARWSAADSDARSGSQRGSDSGTRRASGDREPAHADAAPVPIPIPAPVPASMPVPTVQATPAVTPPKLAFDARSHEPSQAPSAPLRRAAGDGDLIAIVAVAGRYPGADSVDAFWTQLARGYDGITEVPADRWNADDYYAAAPETGKSRCKWGGFLSDVASFDPGYFGMTPREAGVIDPNERLFLQIVQHLFDSGGLTRRRVAERYDWRIGVFVGAMYQQYAAFDSNPVSESLTSIASYGSIANRVSHVFDLRGPSVALDTMCSSALVALHYARESLLRGECRGAIVGGVNLSLHPKKYVGLGVSGMLASAPERRSFGGGDGYLPAEGVGAVLLRPLRDALRDGDDVLAVLRSTHVVHSGGMSPYATPNLKSQVALIEENLDKAGVCATSIGYVEAAATGSALGDAIEMRALGKVFAQPGVPRAIGTVKSNIGHAEAASGMSQLTKVLLQLRHRKWLPTPPIGTPNPEIDWRGAPFSLVHTLCDWPEPVADADINADADADAGCAPPLPRRAAIDSFGAGGTYAHAIVEACAVATKPADADADADGAAQLVVLSAQSARALAALARLHRDWLREPRDLTFARYARALRHERDALTHRVAFVVPDKRALLAELDAYCAGASACVPGARFEGHGDTAPGQWLAAAPQPADRLDRLTALAAHWAGGGDVDWRDLDGTVSEPPVGLPLYPFDRVRCWVEPPETPAITATTAAVRPWISDAAAPGSACTVDALRTLLAEITGLPTHDWDADRALSDYGLRSISFTLLHQALAERFGEIAFEDLRRCTSMREIARAYAGRPASAARRAREGGGRRYPELVALNSGMAGRPVFWIHAGIGGVEVYQTLAQHVERPFFGIQARGYMSERAPLHGLQAMAAYYCHLIVAQQPDGPYSLGGYSLGGALAYEVARQLQELGEAVDSLVMIDSLDGDAMKESSVSTKTLYLQAANMAIGAMRRDDVEQALHAMIHQDDIAADIDDDAFLDTVVEAAVARGVDASAAQLAQRIRHNAAVQAAYDPAGFDLLPLPRPDALAAYYLRNRGGDYFGPLKPYLFVRGESSRLGEADYLRGWRRALPTLSVIDVDARCHMLMLSAQPSLDQVIDACRRIYSSAAGTGAQRALEPGAAPAEGVHETAHA
ncbi:SDR family NAD(P)-dependent oxidoreductase [Burkholderia singularis]|uniref:Malonyl CoA-acyl carrier protein transacylase n=1 Tax=Burkholderia singularis TaxID=1503053 RepID=A0A238H4A2_9BURK|nr:SDR family NAD(P)-dependent oxidoreductase [Burkholderia singularis]SMG00106.1 Malonyl CoA-acyl carrier protein transacylase [Burkholderia singularis]